MKLNSIRISGLNYLVLSKITCSYKHKIKCLSLLYIFYSESPNMDDQMNDNFEVMSKLSVVSNHKQIKVNGFGVSKIKAKIAAAKIALKEIKNEALFL